MEVGVSRVLRSSEGSRRQRRLFALTLALFIVVLAIASAAASGSPRGHSVGHAFGEYIEPHSKHPSGKHPYAVCPAPRPGRAACVSAVVPSPQAGKGPSATFEGSGVEGGYSPADLRSAYKLPSEGGAGLTVAITIAYDDPNAEADLGTYRAHYGLSPCTTANGCFRKVNELGEAANYPAPDSAWGLETSLDLDMVSAICPQCHILLVEAANNEFEHLGPAVERAATMGAAAISNSWAAPEASGELELNHYFNHPGIPTLFGTGDWGYGVYYPASSPDAIAVGGTSLRKSANSRGWTEAAWGLAGSGCSGYEAKPSWQHDEGCAKRTVADVSAVADTETPVSVYDSYGAYGTGWTLLGGTSVATPIMAGVEALSSAAFRASGPSGFWRAGEGGKLFDATGGATAGCTTYLCQGEPGYDGPTGWGTPNEPLDLPVAITEPGTVNSTSKATLKGAVYPGGIATEYSFEYGETTAYGSKTPVPPASAGSGSSYVQVSRAIEGLKGKTTYHYRLVATNAKGTFYGLDKTIGTTPPIASTASANPVGSGGATLNGTVNPEGIATSYYFEYGKTSSYEFRVPVQPSGAGSGTSAVAVSSALTGLAGSTTYHFRTVAKSTAGTSYGGDEVFTTDPPLWTAEHLAYPPYSSMSRSAYDVECLAVRSCIAVGRNWNTLLKAYVPMAQKWSGKSWTAMTVPAPEGLVEGSPYGAELFGISCLSAEECVAVGSYKGSGPKQPFAERWHNGEWTVMLVGGAPAGASDAWLEEVSCVAGQCVAVGVYKDGAGALRAFSKRWTGSSWTTEVLPNPTGALFSTVTGIACPGSTSCFAVGAYEDSSRFEGTLVEQWNGSSWSVLSSPNPAGVAGAELRSVSCALSSSCMAVGTQYSAVGEPLVETWKGSSWSIAPSPPVSDETDLTAVSCGWNTNSCTVMGGRYSLVPWDHGWRSFGQRWNGTSWTPLELQEPDPLVKEWWRESDIQDLACPETNFCTGVGYSLTAPEGAWAYEQAFAAQERKFATATTKEPNNVLPTQAIATGAVNPMGTEATYFFEYGSTKSYGQKLPVTPRVAGSGTTDVEVFQLITGLQPGTMYHYRLVAENLEGRSYGHDVSFTSGSVTPTYQTSFGSSGSGNGQFKKPADAAVDAEGNVWVVDRENNRLEKFNEKGEYLTQFGSKGTGNGQFEGPRAVAIDSSGNLWVTDSGNGRVEKFNAKGEYLTKFGSKGSGNGQFSTYGPKGIAIDAQTNLYVTDYSGRFQKFNSAGEFVQAIGTSGTGEGQFTQTAGIDVGVEGKVWVTDWVNNRVSVFSSSGTFLFSFGSSGSGNGQFAHPDAVEVDNRGNAWVIDEGNFRVQEFTSSGSFVAKFGSGGTGAGQFSFTWPVGLAADDRGYLWVADTNNNRVQKWAIPNFIPSYQTSFGASGSGNGQFKMPADVAVDAEGNVWVVDRENNRLEKFNENGKYLTQFGSKGTGNGQFEGPRAVAIDSSGNLWVTDSGNGRVEKFNSKGEYLSKFGSKGSGNGQFSTWGPKGIAIDAQNNLYVTDYSGRFQKFNSAGEFVQAIGTSGTGEGQFLETAGIEIGPEGEIWVTDWGNSRVSVFNSSGAFLFNFGSYGYGNGQFLYPDTVAVTSGGKVWVADQNNSRVQQFTLNGEYVTKFGSNGTGPGQFRFAWPFGLAADNTRGYLWIADSLNQRVQRWGFEP